MLHTLAPKQGPEEIQNQIVRFELFNLVLNRPILIFMSQYVECVEGLNLMVEQVH